MMRANAVSQRRQSLLLVMAVFACAVPGVSQEPAPPNNPQEAGLPRDSLRDLQSQVKDLSLTLVELQAEITRSRSEAAELRRELEETRDEITSFRQAVSENKASVEDPASSTTNPASPSCPGGALFRKGPEIPQYSRTSGKAESNETQARSTIDQRLTKLEEDRDLLSAKVEDQYQTKVESGSKYRVRLSGIVLLNISGNRGAVDDQDLPTLARLRSPLDTGGNFSATVRQSQVGLEVFGPTLAGAKTSGDAQFDFFGGFPNALNGVTSGVFRVRTARVHLDWPSTSIVAGQDAPFFSPLSPTSMASLASPALSYSGNLWTWTPQVRVEHRLALSSNSEVLVQVGILDPLTGQPPDYQFYRTPQAGEKSGQPAFASRLAWTHPAFGRPLSVGSGSYYARQNWGFGRTVDAWAGTADWSFPLGSLVSITGEFYRGSAIGGLGGGAGRSVLFSGSPLDPRTSVLGLNTLGGWSQIKFRPMEKLEFNVAFGEDSPLASDLGRFSSSQSYVNASIGRNQSAFFNFIYRPRSDLFFATEYRRLWTSQTYPEKNTADHINLSVGILF
jgi:hypothetical protein